MTIATALARFPLRTEAQAREDIARRKWTLDVYRRHDRMPAWFNDPAACEHAFQVWYAAEMKREDGA